MTDTSASAPKLLVQYDPATRVVPRHMDGSIRSQELPPNAVVIPGDVMPGTHEALVINDDDTASIVPDYREWVGYGGADGREQIKITVVGKTPKDLGLTDEPKPETTTEKKARERMEADALAEAQAHEEAEAAAAKAAQEADEKARSEADAKLKALAEQLGVAPDDLKSVIVGVMA